MSTKFAACMDTEQQQQQQQQFLAVDYSAEILQVDLKNLPSESFSACHNMTRKEMLVKNSSSGVWATTAAVLLELHDISSLKEQQWMAVNAFLYG